MWDLPGPGLKPVSPALASRLPTTAPPGKPFNQIYFEGCLLSPHMIPILFSGSRWYSQGGNFFKCNECNKGTICSGEVKVKGTKVKMMKHPDLARAESHYLSFAWHDKRREMMPELDKKQELGSAERSLNRMWGYRQKDRATAEAKQEVKGRIRTPTTLSLQIPISWQYLQLSDPNQNLEGKGGIMKHSVKTILPGHRAEWKWEEKRSRCANRK